MALDKITRRTKIKARIRKRIKGTVQRPRVSIFRSNKHIYAQIIDDTKGQTLVSASTQSKEVVEKLSKLTKQQQAEMIGSILAQKAIEANIKDVVFDRSGYKYHGRVKAFADGARKGGLNF